MKKKLSFEEIKQQSDILTVAQGLGLELNQENSTTWRGRSIIEPGNNDTCLKIDTDSQSWIDFKAGKEFGGSVLDLVAFVKFGGNDGAAITEAAKYLSGGDVIEFSENYKKQKNRFLEMIETAHKNLTDGNDETAQKVRDYLYARRITDETISARKIGIMPLNITVNHEYVTDTRLTVPHLNQKSEPVYMTSRRLDWIAIDGSMKYHKIKQNDFLKNCPYGLDTIPTKDNDCDLLIIGEGMIDALAVIQEGFKALFSGGGDFGAENTPEVIKTAKRFRRVVLAYDGDDAGEKFTKNFGNLLLSAGVDFECVRDYGKRTDENGKDVNIKDISEYYVNGGDINELIENAVRGYEFLAGSIRGDYPFKQLSVNDRQELKKQARQFALKVEKLPSYQEEKATGESTVQKILSEYFLKSDVEKFFKEKSKNEILIDMRDAFLRNREIFYYGSTKRGFFYEYDDRGFWVKATDAEIESELSEFYGHNIENKTVKDLMMKIRLKVQRELLPEFNKKPLLNFSNGVYELETGIFRKAKPEDYLTFQFATKYEPTARNELFERFLSEIACNDTERLKTIRNLLGYLLYPNCKLHKIFFLIGKGRNGKSTFIKILGKLFENANIRADMDTVTYVSPEKFNDDTKIIRLMTSLINLCDDMTPNLGDIGERVKSASADGDLEGNFKFCDTVHFKTRAKIIACSQETPTLSDTSFGLKERLVFINFNADFSKNADRDILEKILKNPEGIFAYIVDCYRELVEQGEIAIYKNDQNAIMAEFIQSSSGYAAFLSDYADEHAGEAVAMKNALSDYLEWCKEQGLKADPKKKPLCVRTFAKEIDKIRPDIIRDRDEHGGVFIFSKNNETDAPTEAVEKAETDKTFELYEPPEPTEPRDVTIEELHAKFKKSYTDGRYKVPYGKFIENMDIKTIAKYAKRPMNETETEKLKKQLIEYDNRRQAYIA